MNTTVFTVTTFPPFESALTAYVRITDEQTCHTFCLVFRVSLGVAGPAAVYSISVSVFVGLECHWFRGSS